MKINTALENRLRRDFSWGCFSGYQKMAEKARLLTATGYGNSRTGLSNVLVIQLNKLIICVMLFGTRLRLDEDLYSTGESGFAANKRWRLQNLSFCSYAQDMAMKGYTCLVWKVTTPRDVQPQCITDGYQIFIYHAEDTNSPAFLSWGK